MKDVLGIILKERNYGESSKILDVFTKEYGIIGVISKGSKKIKSTLSGVSTKMTYGVFHIYYKENKLSTLTGVDIINPFMNIKNSIINIGYATYLSDLVFQVVKQTNAHSEIFDLFINALIKINENYDALVITNIIELKLLSYLGVSPILDKCSICGNVTNIVTLSAFKHGLLCKKCVTNERILDMRTIKFIRMYYYLEENAIVVNTIIPQNKIRQFDKQGNIRDIFTNNKTKTKDFLNEYYSSYTGLYLNSKKFIDDLKRINVYV